MPTWSNQLPREEKHMGFDIHRTPTSRPLRAIITCDDLLICDTHYWGGRTIPCERQQQLPDGSLSAATCPACNESIPYRTHVYVSALDYNTRDHFIFECTSHAAKVLSEHRRSIGTLRGCHFNAFRPKGQPNSKVVIETAVANSAKLPLPEPPNLILALSIIWRLPLTGLAIEHQRFHDPEIKTRKAPIDRMRDQPDNQPDPPRMDAILAGRDNNEPPATSK